MKVLLHCRWKCIASGSANDEKYCSWGFALSNDVSMLFVSLVVSTETNRWHYSRSNLRICGCFCFAFFCCNLLSFERCNLVHRWKILCVCFVVLCSSLLLHVSIKTGADYWIFEFPEMTFLWSLWRMWVIIFLHSLVNNKNLQEFKRIASFSYLTLTKNLVCTAVFIHFGM